MGGMQVNRHHAIPQAKVGERGLDRCEQPSTDETYDRAMNINVLPGEE